MARHSSTIFLAVVFVLSVWAVASDSDPAWSPDGKKIVFMSDRDGDIEIYTADSDGTNAKRLTHSPGRDAHPAFSQDGKKIAFQSPRGEQQPQIYVMDADGSTQTKLTGLPGFSGVPDWSPDDKQIIFQSNVNPTLDPAHWQIFLMDADGSALKQITHDEYNDQVPKWSPDGRGILFYSDRTGRNQIYTVRPDGSNWQRVLSSSRDDHAGSWSHDGQRILFSSDAGQGVNVYTFDRGTKQVKQLTTNDPGLGIPFWSADEKTIAFTVRRGEQSDVYFMDADGANQRPALAGPHNVTSETEGPHFGAQGAFAALVVTDLEASLRWYEINLGLHVIKRGVSPRVAAETAVLGGHNVFVELIHFIDRSLPKRVIDDHAPVAGPVKVGMIVGAEDFDSLNTYLEKRGVSAGIFEDKEMGARVSIVKDNDGNMIQFFAINR